MATNPSAAPQPTSFALTLPADDASLYSDLAAAVIDHLERDWHEGRCGCPAPATGADCHTYGARWRDHGPITFTPETVLFALRDVAAERAVASPTAQATAA